MAGNPYFRHRCTTTWQTSAENAKDAFAIWLSEVAQGTINHRVRLRHIGLARRFRDALHATTVSWLPVPDIEFTIVLPGGWQIWMEIVPGTAAAGRVASHPPASTVRPCAPPSARWKP